MTDEQVFAHAELNLLKRAVKQFAPDVLATSTLYANADASAMCAGAIFWSGVSPLVYGLSGDRLHEMSGFSPQMLVASARNVLAHAGRQVEIIGPIFETEAEALFAEAL